MRYVVINNYFAPEPVKYEGQTATEIAEAIADDYEKAFGWRPNLEVMIDGTIAIRWVHRWVVAQDGWGPVFDGEPEFDRGAWLRQPNWATVAVPA